MLTVGPCGGLCRATSINGAASKVCAVSHPVKAEPSSQTPSQQTSQGFRPRSGHTGFVRLQYPVGVRPLHTPTVPLAAPPVHAATALHPAVRARQALLLAPAVSPAACVPPATLVRLPIPTRYCVPPLAPWGGPPMPVTQASVGALLWAQMNLLSHPTPVRGMYSPLGTSATATASGHFPTVTVNVISGTKVHTASLSATMDS